MYHVFSCFNNLFMFLFLLLCNYTEAKKMSVVIFKCSFVWKKGGFVLLQYKQTNMYKISLSRQITWFSSTLLPLRHRCNLKRKASVVQCKVMAPNYIVSCCNFWSVQQNSLIQPSVCSLCVLQFTAMCY